jgi:transcription-repair coupling factor (superfamily II helicase)
MAAQQHPTVTLLITPDSYTAARLEMELAFFRTRQSLEILVFPDWETLPYDIFSPHQDIVSQRLSTLYRLPDARQCVLIVPVATLLQRLAPRRFLDNHALLLSVGETLDQDSFRLRLEAAGYNHVAQVMEHGEFTIRGSIIDLFPAGSEQPYRIDLFDDEVESIRVFDPDSQRSIEKIDRIELLPAREFPLSKEAITLFRQNFRSTFDGDVQRSPLYRDVSGGNAPGGVEYYLPLFFETTATLFDYLPDSTLVVQLPGVEEAVEEFQEQVQQRYEQRRYDIERPILPPRQLFLDNAQLTLSLRNRPGIRIGNDPAGDCRFAAAEPPELGLNPRADHPAARLQTFLREFPGRTLIAAESAGRRELLLENLKHYDIRPRLCDSWIRGWYYRTRHLRLLRKPSCTVSVRARSDAGRPTVTSIPSYAISMIWKSARR